MAKQSKLENALGVSLRSAYIPHDPVDLDCGEVSMTRQEFAEECDINSIMAKYDKVGGFLPPQSGVEPQYLDLTELPMDFHSAMEAMQQAENAFMSLPATVRRSFENNPAYFVDFAMDPDNLDQLREWGLAPPAKAPEPPMKVEIVSSGSAGGGDQAKPGSSPPASGTVVP